MAQIAYASNLKCCETNAIHILRIFLFNTFPCQNRYKINSRKKNKHTPKCPACKDKSSISVVKGVTSSLNQ